MVGSLFEAFEHRRDIHNAVSGKGSDIPGTQAGSVDNRRLGCVEQRPGGLAATVEIRTVNLFHRVHRKSSTDSCKNLRQLQELSVLTGLGPRVTLRRVIYGLGEQAPS